MSDRPQVGNVEERSSEQLATEGRRIRGVIPYGVSSRSMGGWTEEIAPGALRNADFDELRAVVDHQGVPLASYPRTLELEDRSDGLHWSFEPPQSRADVIEAVERGDMRSGSWRMVVGKDRWAGDHRIVEQIRALRDVSISGSSTAIYPQANVEFRSEGTNIMADEATVTPAPEATEAPTPATTPESAPEERSAPDDRPPGTLRVSDRSGTNQPRRGLADEFRARGFPGERAEMPWEEYEERAVVWSASVDLIGQVQRVGGPLGFDQRYAWPAFARVGVGADTTSVRVLQQTARALATAANVVSAVDAVTTKPETGSTLNLDHDQLEPGCDEAERNPERVSTDAPTSIRDRAGFEAGDQRGPRQVDPRHRCRERLPDSRLQPVHLGQEVHDHAVRQWIQPGSRRLDTGAMRGARPVGLGDCVRDGGFRPGPRGVRGRRVRAHPAVSKTIPASTVFDSTAFGKMYAGPVSLAKFEENFGQSNSPTVRLELNAGFGMERQAAAVESQRPDGQVQGQGAAPSRRRPRQPEEGGAEGRSRVRRAWRLDHPPPQDPAAASKEAMTYPPLDLEAIRPKIADVARLIQHRTVGTGGGEEGTFTSTTRPTAAQCESLIDLALEQVASVDLPPLLDPALYPAAKLCVGLWAARLIEISFFVGQAAPGLQTLYSTRSQGCNRRSGLCHCRERAAETRLPGPGMRPAA